MQVPSAEHLVDPGSLTSALPSTSHLMGWLHMCASGSDARPGMFRLVPALASRPLP